MSKSEIRHGSIDSMSKEEVQKALEELKRTYGAIDITPDEDGSGIIPAIEGSFEEVEEELNSN